MSLRIKLDGNSVLKEVIEEKGDYYAVLGIVSEVKSDSKQLLAGAPFRNFRDIELRVPIKEKDYLYFQEKLKENRYGVDLNKEGMLEIILID